MDFAFARRSSRRLWTRAPGRPLRFAFAPGVGLALENVSEAGRAAYSEVRGRMKLELGPGETLVGGALVVDADHRLVFAGPGLGRPLLEDLADFTRRNLAPFPALFALADAGVAEVPLDLKDDAALVALEPERLPVVRAPELWEGLLPATASTVAAVLAAARPGERLWLWVDPRSAPGEVPLLVQPVQADPDRHRMEHLVGELFGGLPDTGVSGFALPLEDGRMQLVARGLDAAALRRVARWVLAEVAAHPGLARLAHAELVSLDDVGAVTALRTTPEAWGETKAPAPPTTLVAAALGLEALPIGADAWLWLASTGEALWVRPVATDPDGAAFRDDLDSLEARFPAAAARALRGVARRLPDRTLLVTAAMGDPATFVPAVRALVEAHGDLPGLHELGAARLVEQTDGRPARVHAAGAER